MPRLFFRLIPVALALGLAATVPSAAAAGPETPGSVDPRAIETSRVVEHVDIGILGDPDPVVTRSRSSTGKRIGASIRLEATPNAAVTAVGGETCWWARPTWTRYNGFGKLSSKAWYYIEWCGRDGRVSRVLTLYCDGVAAGGFSYSGCSIRRGATGYSRVDVSGTWKFPFRIGMYTFLTRTVTVSARHYATGRAAGTWWMYQ